MQKDILDRIADRIQELETVNAELLEALRGVQESVDGTGIPNIHWIRRTVNLAIARATKEKQDE